MYKTNGIVVTETEEEYKLWIEAIYDEETAAAILSRKKTQEVKYPEHDTEQLPF